MVPVPAAKAAGIAPRCQAPHPPTLQMVKEALRAHDEKKGASVVAIKRFILTKYPSVDPIRLKYLLKQALSKGLSCGDLVRPHRSTAVGATGTFKVSEDAAAAPDRGQAPKPGQKGSTKDPQAPVAGAQPRGKGLWVLGMSWHCLAAPGLICCPSSPGAAKQQPKVKPVKVSWGQAKHPQTADQPQAHGPGPSGPPKAAGHRQAPQKGHSAPSTARAAEKAGGSDSDSSASAGAKAPRGKSKGKMPKGAQQDAPQAQGGQDKAKKPHVTARAGQGKARMKKAAPLAADRKAP
uniref:H1.8 linker histone n=1 Tax=Serinus canaria TaxID=9135 RepID=A0A8C9NUU7_SERCA